MIVRVVDFALQQRFITLTLAALLAVSGIVAFERLPLEAYPDVGDVTVQVVTVWPGHATEELERVVTIPLENELNGIARVVLINVVGGLISSTVLTLLVLPAVYAPLTRRRPVVLQ